jgi:putative endonuclease
VPIIEKIRARVRRFVHDWIPLPAARPTGPGADAEIRAADWLERQRGMRIVARNWRSPRNRRHELDLVARDAGILVFVEVKSRPATALVPGYSAATKPRKKRAVLRAARDYVRTLREKPRTIRYDVVEVATNSDGAPPEIRHYENVPLFSKEFLRGR